MIASSLLVVAPLARAAEPPAPTAASAPRGSLARARDLFFQGVAAQSAGDWEAALGFFRRSLDESATWRSTMNAAFCLGKLERYDEALAMYEAMLTSFAAELDPAERAKIDVAITLLQKKVASVEITTNVEATILVDGAPRGESRRGAPRLVRVAAGTHRIELRSDGYKPFDRTFDLAAGATILVYAVLETALAPVLPALPPSPPPPPPTRPHGIVTAFAGYAIGASLGGTAETGAKVLSHPPVSGFLGGMRGGYAFSVGLALEASLGYLYAVSTPHRTVDKPSFADSTAPDGIPLTYDLADSLHLRGPLFGAGASYRAALDERLSFLFRTTVGLFAARSTDPVEGTVCREGQCTNAGTLRVSVSGKGQILDSTSGFVMPELGIDAKWGDLRAGLSLGLLLLTADGPSFANREVGVDPSTCRVASGVVSAACAPNKPLWEPDPGDPRGQKVIELAYRSFAPLWVPQLSVTYSF